MNESVLKFKSVSPKEQIHFKCAGCGACCKNIYQSVPIETLDAFRIAQHLQDQGEAIETMDDFWQRYGEPVLLDECGYFFYFLKTKDEEQSCIFLQDNRCTIHAVNPRACRLYPFTVDPGTGQYLVAQDRKHHFSGPAVKVKTWMKQRYLPEDREFMRIDYGSARQLAILLRAIPEQERARAVLFFQFYKYSDYDLDKPFLPQCEKNHERLIQALAQLAKESKSV